MSHPKIFESHGLSHDKLKAYWTGTGKNEKRERLRDLIRDRIKDGMWAGLKDHAIWYAVDLAYDAPFNQLSPTIVQNILSRKHETSEIIDALKRWNVGFNEILTETVDSSGCTRQVLDIPAFFQVIVPLVKAYVTIRRAKLFNDRNLVPLFKFEPAHSTPEGRVIGSILTDIIRVTTQQFGYPAILKQAILQMLNYGTCLMLPMEEWYREKQIVMAEEGKPEEQVIKEGLRYHMPHPTRCYIDPNHAPSSINTDTGCEYIGYWRLQRYATIDDDPAYWNKDQITYGATDWMRNYPTYFSEVYPCHMIVPSGSSLNTMQSDRQEQVLKYSSNNRDQGVFVNELFMRLVPEDWGMGDYAHSTWFRFVVASDDWVIYCAPLCYCPGIYLGYDPDDSRCRNSSMALETVWAQDHMGNLLSQFLFSVKQNLSKVVFYDTDQVDAEQVKQVENLGKKKYQGVPFIPYSSRAARVAGVDPSRSFTPVNFPVLDTASIAQAMNTIISILERVLVLSAQEIGQAATHEQTAEETRVISVNTSTRVAFTGTALDDGIDAWKRQLYLAHKAYLPEEVTGQVSMDIPGAVEALKKLGFDVPEKKTEAQGDDLTNVRAVVKAKVGKLNLDDIISTREGSERINNTAVAAAMSQLLQVALANPMTAQAIGPEQALDMITKISQIAGLPKDFELKVSKNAAPEVQMEQIAGQFKQMADQIQQQLQEMGKQAVETSVKLSAEQIGKPLADQLQQTNAQVAQNTQQIQEIGDATKAIISQIQQLSQLAVPPPEPTPLPAAPMPYDTGQPPPAPSY